MIGGLNVVPEVSGRRYALDALSCSAESPPPTCLRRGRHDVSEDAMTLSKRKVRSISVSESGMARVSGFITV